MMSWLRKAIKRLLGSKKYLSSSKKRELLKDSEKDIREEVDDKIAQMHNVASIILDEEKREWVEIDVLLEVLKEDIDYYTIEEIQKITSNF